MNKKILGILIVGIIAIAGIVSAAMTATQNLTVTIVPGILNIMSPVEGNIYQSNHIPVTFNLTSPYNVKNIWLIDNGALSPLCSKCKSFSENIFFSEGNHSVTIKVEFENNNSIEKKINFFIDSMSDIYLLSSGGLKKASSKDITNYLFNYDFSVIYKNEPAPEDSCSIRAKGGNATINEEEFGTNNKLNFYSVSSIEQGQGELYAQKNRKVFSLKFKVDKIIENSEEFLIIEISGKNNQKAVLEFDRVSKKININGEDFSFADLNVNFIEGCTMKKSHFYFLEKEAKVQKNIDDIRNILTQNPIFIKKYENLKFLFSKYWWFFQFFR